MPSITTNDGVRLTLVEKGRGRPLVLVPGWSQTARQFAAQIDGLADRYRVIAVDMRGHGQSEKPASGYKIQRLAQDLKDVLDALDLDDAAVAGHSMGSSILWCYWDLFGAHRIGSAIFIDQMPAITSLPSWSEAERLTAGAIFDHVSLPTTIEALAGPQGVETTAGFVGGMFTAGLPCGPGGRGGRAQSADATSARGDPALQSRYTGLARRDPAGRLEDARGRWHGQFRIVAVADLDSPADRGLAAGAVRCRRRWTTLHVHGESR